MTEAPLHPITLLQLLSHFRGELDGVLRELTVLSGPCPPDVDQQLRDLHEELRRAIYQLESTLDFLIPLEDWVAQPPQLQMPD